MVWKLLTGRKLYVHVDSSNSNYSKIETEVTQGSVLGQLLFLSYINAIANNIVNVKDCI